MPRTDTLLKELLLALFVVVLFWTGAAQAVVEARKGPLKPQRAMAVLVLVGAWALVGLWRAPTPASSPEPADALLAFPSEPVVSSGPRYIRRPRLIVRGTSGVGDHEHIEGALTS